MKYQTIIANEYSDKIGTVTIDGQEVQLCDHIEIVKGRYHVSALYDGAQLTPILEEMGAPTKDMGDAHVAYLTADLLKKAIPVYKDGMTGDLIKRLIKAVTFMNEKKQAA